MNQIKSHITCETSNVIYMIQCTKCNLQYIGETKRRLKERFNEHRRPIINTSSYNPTAVSRHFITGNHTVNHMLLIPLEKLFTNRDSVRKAREAFLIHRGNTLEPAGLNRRDEMYSNQLFPYLYYTVFPLLFHYYYFSVFLTHHVALSCYFRFVI